MANVLWGRIFKGLDKEMWQKGWWMLALILGSIAVLFTVCTVLVARY